MSFVPYQAHGSSDHSFLRRTEWQGPRIWTCWRSDFFHSYRKNPTTPFCSKTGSAAHFHREVRRFLNAHLPRCWIGRSIHNTDLPLEEWPPRSPDVIPCDLLLWGHVKNLVFVLLLSHSLKDMKESILATVSTIDGDKLQRVWDGWRVTCDTRDAYWASVRLRTNCESFNTNYFRLHVHIVLSYCIINFWRCSILF
jgi:hypothetical protein